MLPFRAFQSAGSELETLPVKYLRWTLSTAGIPPFTPVVSSEFQFEGAQCSLEFCKSKHYEGPLHGLYLSVKQAETSEPVMVTAQLETERSGRIVTELSQETLVFTNTRIPKRIVWMKYDKEVLEADPEFCRTGILKLLVVLKGRGAIPLAHASTLRSPSDSSTKAESSSDTKAAAAPTEFLLNLTTGALSCLDTLPQDLAKHLESDSKPDTSRDKKSSSSSTDS